MPERREYGTGGISWLGPRKVRLRVWVPSEVGGKKRVTRVVRVRDKEHGGIGQAKAALNDLIQESAKLDIALPTAETTFAAMLTDYIAQCKRTGRAQSTVESFTYSIRRVPEPLRSVPLSEVTSHDLDSFYGQLADRLTDNTIRQTAAIINSALELGVKWGRIPTNPAKGATPPKRHRPRRTPLSVPDVKDGQRGRDTLRGRQRGRSGAGNGHHRGIPDWSEARRAVRAEVVRSER